MPRSRSGGRLWDEDIRRTAKRMAEMQDVKSFVASTGWLSGFKRRYGLKAIEEGGDIQLDFGPEPTNAEFPQRCACSNFRYENFHSLIV